MTPIITTEMEPPTNRRYQFALSSFARMYGVTHVTEQMHHFCYDWALGDEHAPLDNLHNVDLYFREKYAIR